MRLAVLQGGRDQDLQTLPGRTLPGIEVSPLLDGSGRETERAGHSRRAAPGRPLEGRSPLAAVRILGHSELPPCRWRRRSCPPQRARATQPRAQPRSHRATWNSTSSARYSNEEPPAAADERALLLDTIDQAKTADREASAAGGWSNITRPGEFSRCSAPELLLGWIASETQRLRVGHSGVLAPFQINHPIRVAERAAMLDQMS